MRIPHLLVLLACLAAGELLRVLTGSLLSASLLGMVVLAGWLGATGGPDPAMRSSMTGLLGFLPLLFVPVGAGIIRQSHVMSAYWLPILASLLVSTTLSLVIGGLVAQWVKRSFLKSRRNGKSGLEASL